MEYEGYHRIQYREGNERTIEVFYVRQVGLLGMAGAAGWYWWPCFPAACRMGRRTGHMRPPWRHSELPEGNPDVGTTRTRMLRLSCWRSDRH
jgi:hypothetical protein